MAGVSGTLRSSLQVLRWADGSELSLPLSTVRGETEGPTLALLAGVHGDEYEGIRAIPEILDTIEPRELRGTILAVPCCNPPAYLSATRTSPIDGLNLARVFPGDPRGTATQRIAHVLAEQVIGPASFLVDLHSAGIAYTMPTLVGYAADDTPLGRASAAAARAFGAPVMWGHPHDPTATGRTVSEAGDRGIPWLYTEAAGGGRTRDDDVQCYVRGVLNVLRHLGMLPDAPEPTPPALHLLGRGNLDASLVAGVSGYFVSDVALLEPVRAGQRLGRILGFAGELLEEITAPDAGRVVLIRGLPKITAGEWTFSLTGDAPEGRG
jgi:predicted deacylase